MPSHRPDNKRAQSNKALIHRLDEAAVAINNLDSSGSLSDSEIDDLAAQEQALRYQMQQLHSAGPDATNDLLTGLELSCAELERQVAAASKDR